MQIKDISDTPDSNEVHWKGVDVFLIVLGILLIFFFAILTIGIWSRFHALSTLNITPSETIGLTGLEGIALIGGVYLMGIRRRRFRWRDIGLRELNQKWLYISIVSAVVVIPLSGIIAELILMALGRPLENPQLEFILPEGFSWIDSLIMLALAGFIVPFAEELFFRGVIYKYIRDLWGVWPGVIISSLIFGISHGDIAIGGATVVIGIILSLVYEYSQSLWASVIVHAVNNSVKLIFIYSLLTFGLNIK